MTKLEKWALFMFIIGIVYLPQSDGILNLIYMIMAIGGGFIFINTGNNK